MGDLNDDPTNSSITKGLKATGNAKNIAPEALYNPWVSMYKSGAGTLAYQDAWSLFDQIIISPSFLNKDQPGFFFYRNNIFKAAYMIENLGKYKGILCVPIVAMCRSGTTFPTYIVLVDRTISIYCENTISPPR